MTIATRTRGGRGFSLVELLAATALIGLCATTAAGIVHRQHAAALRAEADEDAFRARHESALRLRAAAGRAESARLEAGRLILRAGGRDESWCARGGVLIREHDDDASASDGACDAGALAVARVGRATMLRVTLDGRDEAILVGGRLP